MLVNAVIGIIITFIVVVALLYVGLNTVIFMGILIINELKSKYTGTESSKPMEIGDVDWTQTIVYQADYWYIYIVVGIYALIKFTMYTIKTLKDTVIKMQDNRRKEKEASVARKVNHERKMLEYKAQTTDIKQAKKNEQEYYTEDDTDYSVPKKSKKPTKSKARPRSEIIADTQANRIKDESDELVLIEDYEDEQVTEDMQEVIEQVKAPRKSKNKEDIIENLFDDEQEEVEKVDIDVLNDIMLGNEESDMPPPPPRKLNKNTTERVRKPRRQRDNDTTNNDSQDENKSKKSLLEIQQQRAEILRKQREERQKKEQEESERLKKEREKNDERRKSRMQQSKDNDDDDYELHLKGFGNQD